MSTPDPFFAEPADTFQEEARLMAEVATLLLEWGQKTSGARLVSWFLRCGELAENGGSELMLYLQAQSGDTSVFSGSFQERGDAVGLTKQAIHKAFHAAMDRMGQRAPVVADAIAALRQAHTPAHGELGGYVDAAEDLERVE